MMRTSTMLFVIFGIVVVAGCNRQSQKSSYEFVEWAEVKGTCFEDHVRKSANYKGDLVHWRDKNTGTSSRYGSVTNWEVLSKSKNPYDYEPPFIVSFENVSQEQFSASSFILHGISEQASSGTNVKSPEYKATCELYVTRRLDHLPSDSERKGESS